MSGLLEGFSAATPLSILGCAIAAYAIGSIPWAYTIVRLVTGEDITAHGTGNVGAMNVRRSTGSWGWFAVAMLADLLKGVVPVAVAKWMALGTLTTPLAVVVTSGRLDVPAAALIPMAAILGVVLGHNYSVWMALIKRRFCRTGKGLATGAGALLAYDWRYFLAVVIAGLVTIAITRYMMAGQVVAALALPVASLALGSPDFPFMLLMGGIVYAAHHKRFVGMLRGREPKFYIHDGGGPRG